MVAPDLVSLLACTGETGIMDSTMTITNSITKAGRHSFFTAFIFIGFSPFIIDFYLTM